MSNDQQTKAEAFVALLEERRDDRAVMARLKRGLGRILGEAPMADGYIYHWSSALNPNVAEERNYHLIATLFALHPAAGGRGNMGDHFRELWRDKKEPPSNVERRFMTLLAAEREDLPDALRHAVSLLKSKDVPVNWRELLTDVTYWGLAVRRRWAKAFWGGGKSRAEESGDQSVVVTAQPASPGNEFPG